MRKCLCFWRWSKSERIRHTKVTVWPGLVLLTSFLVCYTLGVVPMSWFQAAMIAVVCGIPFLLPTLFGLAKEPFPALPPPDDEDVWMWKVLIAGFVIGLWPLVALVALRATRQSQIEPPDQNDELAIRRRLRANKCHSRQNGWFEIKREPAHSRA